jgi:hypothetical protein
LFIYVILFIERPRPPSFQSPNALPLSLSHEDLLGPCPPRARLFRAMSSGEEEHFAAGEVPPKETRTPRKRRDGRTTAAETDTICYLCLKGCEKGAVRTYQGLPIHVKACWNGLRARNRVLDQNPAMRIAADKQMREDAPQWRLEMAPFCDSSNMTQRKSSLKALKVEVSRVVKSNTQKHSEKKVSDNLILSRVRYVSYRCHWDRITPSEASEEFWNEHSEQEGEHDDAEPRVSIKDNERMRVTDGASTAKTTQQETVVGDTALEEKQDNYRKRRERSPTPKPDKQQPRRGRSRGHGDDGDRRRRRDRSPSRSTKVTRGRSSASVTPVVGAIDLDVDDGQSVDTLMSARLGLSGFKIAGKQRRPRGYPMPSRPMPGIDNAFEKPSTLLKLKKDMKTKLDKLIEDMTGKKRIEGQDRADVRRGGATR